MATPEQIAEFQKTTQIGADDLAARVGLLTLEKERLIGLINTYIERLGTSQSENTQLTAQNAALQASQTAQARTLEGTASPVNEAATV